MVSRTGTPSGVAEQHPEGDRRSVGYRTRQPPLDRVRQMKPALADQLRVIVEITVLVMLPTRAWSRSSIG
jgi:hypothetical protein